MNEFGAPGWVILILSLPVCLIHCLFVSISSEWEFKITLILDNELY